MKAGTVLYTYNMRRRPLDFGTAPDGWVDYLPDKSRWGWVVYPRQLTDDEIHEYELEPVSNSESKRLTCDGLTCERIICKTLICQDSSIKTIPAGIGRKR